MAQDSFAALPDLLHYQNRWWICGDVALGVANQVGTPEKVGGSSQWLPPNWGSFVVSRLWVFLFLSNLCLLIMVPSRFSWFLITNYPELVSLYLVGFLIFPDDLLLKGPHGN